MKGGIPAEGLKKMKAHAMPPATAHKHGDGPKGNATGAHGDRGPQITLTHAGTYASFKGSPKGPPKKSMPKPLYGMPTPA